MKSPARPRSQNGGALKIILIIVGVVALLGIIVLVAGGWYAKTQIDKAGGMEAFSAKLMATGLELMEPEINKSLTPEDQTRLNEAIAQIKTSSAGMTTAQIQAVSKAIQDVSEKLKGGNALAEDDAVAFVDALTRALQPTESSTPTEH